MTDILVEVREALSLIQDLVALTQVEKKYLGKNGSLKAELKKLKDLPPEEKAQFAQEVQSKIQQVEAWVADKARELEAKQLEAKFAKEWVDISLPGTQPSLGARHPIKQFQNKLLTILKQLGFSLGDGPEVETAFYNFDALNIPEHHPARDMQDTFWLENNLLLRSHTTTVQARVLEQHPKLPIKIAIAGRVYRNEAVDATHLAMFHQLDGFWLEENLNFSHLKGLLTLIVHEMYGENYPLRFKPKFYPYTEPSIGVDIQCTACQGLGCGACHQAGWVTILGAGMIHRNVLELFKFNDPTIRGFAFGFGLTRMVSQYLSLSKLKGLYENDQRLFNNIQRSGL